MMRAITLGLAALGFSGRVAALNNGVALTPPRGFSTWNAWPDNGKAASGNSIDHATASRYLRGMVDAGLNKLGYEYFIVDEPCFVGRDANGNLIENKTTWPNGLKAFAGELAQAGMKLGVYTCVGPKTCGGCIASEGHEDQDMQTFVDWGARYVKVDSCSRNCTPAAGVNNASKCGQILWSRYTSALNKTGIPVVYSIVCNCDPSRGSQPWKWAADFANSWRTNIDIQIGFQSVKGIIDAQRRMSGNGTWCPANPKDPEGKGVPCHGHGGPEQYSGIGHWNDMDMLAIGTRSTSFREPLTISQSRAQFSMWSALKSPLLVSADLTNLSSPEYIEILKNTEVIAVSEDPLGREAVRLEDQPGSQSVGEIYAGPLVDGYVAVFFNRVSNTANNFTLHLADVVPPGSSSYAIRDLWTHTDNGTVLGNGHLNMTVPPEDVVMIKLTKVTSHAPEADGATGWSSWW